MKKKKSFGADGGNLSAVYYSDNLTFTQEPLLSAILNFSLSIPGPVIQSTFRCCYVFYAEEPIDSGVVIQGGREWVRPFPQLEVNVCGAGCQNGEGLPHNVGQDDLTLNH